MRIFITGLSGSLGTALALLHHSRGDLVFGCSRSEARAVSWLSTHQADLPATLLLADARDLACWNTEVGRLLPSIDRLYHCAALKHVEICERHPFEAVCQNVELASLVAVACKEVGVPLVFVSSDKACLPQGVYGATKLMAERIVLAEDGSVVRLGNLIGSSGSVFEKWATSLREGQGITITDPSMTRFFIPIQEAALFLSSQSQPGVVVFPEMRAARMLDVAEAVHHYFYPDVSAECRKELRKITGARPGESTDQWIAAPGDRVRREEGRIVLNPSPYDPKGAGDLLVAGLSSARAPRWGIGELLREAGVGGL